MIATIQYIGEVHSELRQIEDCPLQESENAPEAKLIIFPEFMDGIRDLTPGSEILVLTWLHQADRSVIRCYPRNNTEAPHVGVFSTRSPDRPNPIGIHRVKILSISTEGIIKVSNLEVLDKTPIVDIKPVLD